MRTESRTEPRFKIRTKSMFGIGIRNGAEIRGLFNLSKALLAQSAGRVTDAYRATPEENGALCWRCARFILGCGWLISHSDLFAESARTRACAHEARAATAGTADMTPYTF
ncbi:hypothetical protein EVAR_20782_1 [Eumeta japonica]|uniref:Uncharacterized protein n=1 Tax=Eumeta variegata TaxID=151549 RepID=A0A4C1UDK4_EUMVA|nr:hypothetical protein EVAR_20782_1 [Eumeta japonica]